MLPVVYDSIGKATWPASLDCLQQRGLFVTFGNASGPIPPIDPLTLSSKGSLVMTRPTLFHFADTPERMRRMAGDVMKVIKSGAVKIEVNHKYSLREARALIGISRRAKQPDRSFWSHKTILSTGKDKRAPNSAPFFILRCMGSALLVHQIEEFVVRLGAFQLVEQKLHRIDHAHWR